MKIFAPTLLNTILDRDANQFAHVEAAAREALRRSVAEFSTLEAAIASGDVDYACKILHSMRGGIGTLGAVRFAEESLRAQQQLRDGERVDIEKLREFFDQFAAAIQAWLEQRGPQQ